MDEEYRKGNIRIREDGRLERRKYESDYRGEQAPNIWTDIAPVQGQAHERTGYPTQKPLALYRRIVQASSNPGDIVFDPFAGCATTPAAVPRSHGPAPTASLWTVTASLSAM